jgi:hypothetical protein
MGEADLVFPQVGLRFIRIEFDLHKAIMHIKCISSTLPFLSWKVDQPPDRRRAKQLECVPLVDCTRAASQRNAHTTDSLSRDSTMPEMMARNYTILTDATLVRPPRTLHDLSCFPKNGAKDENW